MKKITPQQMLERGVHLGHKRQRIHPKSKKNIYSIESGASIIDLFKTEELLSKAQQYAFELGESGKQMLFVGTKKTARDIIDSLCKKNNLLYLSSKWVGGLMTNFEEIRRNVTRMIESRGAMEAGDWNKLPKHEQVELNKKLTRAGQIYNGVEKLEALPDCLFIVDIRKEKNAVEEARRLGIATIAIVDTNSDPGLVTYPIPGNDDSQESIELLTNAIVEAYVEGREKYEKLQSKEKKLS